MRLRSDSVSASSSAMPGWAYGTLSKPETAKPLFSRGVSITVRRLELAPPCVARLCSWARASISVW